MKNDMLSIDNGLSDNEAINDDFLHKIKGAIKQACAKRPSHTQVLEFVQQVLAEQSKSSPHVDIDGLQLDDKLILTKTKEGFPLLDKTNIKLDMDAATVLFSGLAGILRHNDKVCGDVDKIEHAVSRKDVELESLFQETAGDDGAYLAAISEKYDLKTEILAFLAYNSLTPIFEAYARKLERYVDHDHWWQPYCPICGSKPVVAKLVSLEKKRFLVCSRCSHAWRFSRTKCPYCEQDQTRKMKYFIADEANESHRVETCPKCMQYIKTIDTEALGKEAFPLVEDMATLYLDVLAKKEGYTRGVHPLALDMSEL